MTIDVILGLLSGLLGCTTIVSYILYRGSEKRIKTAEAELKETEADRARYEMYEERLKHSNEIIELHNGTIQHQSETIATLNEALDSKTARIRQLTDDMYVSERKINDINDELLQATETIGKQELTIAKLRLWRCDNADCAHRVPPSPTIKGHKFDED